MPPAALLIIYCVLAGIFAANCPLALSLLGNYLRKEKSFVSPDRRPPMDSDLRIAKHLTILGLLIAAIGIWLGWPNNSLIWIPVMLASWFLGNFYGFRYTRMLNRFYLKRARTLLEEGDLRGAREDAHEVIRCSAALRPQAQTVLRATEEASEFHPTHKPVEAFVAAATLIVD